MNPGMTNTRPQDAVFLPRELPDDHLIETFHPLEADPTGRDPHQPGAKLDAGKTMAGVMGDFSKALLAVADVGTFGAKKYSRGGWQTVPDGQTRYTDAMWRHLLKERHQSLDEDSGLHHAAHLAWNALARLELMLRDNEVPENASSPTEKGARTPAA